MWYETNEMKRSQMRRKKKKKPYVTQNALPVITPYEIINPRMLSVRAVSIRPLENRMEAITLILRYPKWRSNGPFIKPSDIDNAELMFMIRVKSAAGIFISANLSLNIKPKLLVVGMPTNCKIENKLKYFQFPMNPTMNEWKTGIYHFEWKPHFEKSLRQ